MHVLGPDLIVHLSGFLNGRDLLAFSQTSKSISSSLTESIWKQLFKRDFGAHGLDARNVLEARHPDISWQASYWHCVNRQVYIWGDLEVLCLSMHSDWYHCRGSNLNSIEPMALDLPTGMVVRDIGHSRTTVYVLTIEGRIRAMHPTGSTSKVRIEFYENPRGKLEDQPAMFCEMTVLPDSDIIAVDAQGTWWLWNKSQWSTIFAGPIWPGALTSTYWGTAVALSACGRYVYAADNIDLKTWAHPIPSLATGPPLEHIDNFLINVNYGVESFMTCLQVDGRSYVHIISESLDDEAQLSFEFESNNYFVEICLQEHGDAFVSDEDEEDGDIELLNEFVMQFTAANGEVLKGLTGADPAKVKLVSSQRQLPKGCIQELVFLQDGHRLNFDRTSAGELYCSGTFMEDHEFLTGCSLEDQITRINVPPVTRFCLNEICVLALCFT